MGSSIGGSCIAREKLMFLLLTTSKLTVPRNHLNGRLTNRDPASPNLQGMSCAFEIPTRGLISISAIVGDGRSSNGALSSGNRSCAPVIPSA
jgi:hypothetical protein